MKIVGIVPSTASPYLRVYKIFRLGLPILLTKAKNEEGHQAIMVDENVSDIDLDWLKEETSQADLIAFSAVTASYNKALWYLNLIRGLGIKTPVVIGGVHVTFEPEKALDDGFDFVIRYEGELTFPLFLRALENGDDFSQVPNLCWKKNGEKTYNPISSSLPDLDKDSPFPDFQDKNLFPQWDNNCKLPIETSRSCPYHCEFCSVHPMFGKYRQRKDLGAVIEQIRKMEPESIFIVDDCWASYQNTKRSKEFMILALSRLTKIPHLDVQIRIDSSRDKEWLNLAKRANLTWAGVGIETNNPEALAEADKKQTLESIEKDLAAFRDAGLGHILHAFLMVGFDSDDKSTASELVKWDKKLIPDAPQLAIVTPFPGTALRQRLKKENRLLPAANNPELCDGAHVVFTPIKMTAAELQESWTKGGKEAATLRENIWFGLRGLLGYTKDWLADIKNEERLRKHFRKTFLGWRAWQSYKTIRKQNKGYLDTTKRK